MSMDSHFCGMARRGGMGLFSVSMDAFARSMDAHFGGITGRGGTGLGAMLGRGDPAAMRRPPSTVKEPSPLVKLFFGYMSCGESEPASRSSVRCFMLLTGL
mmetsp:Transcript_54941/g.75467  ORF Transcript_54941/g.75467 Transcript_54941/m.75467 type:complete len:101 (+) Transcript_54941:726-1028(+)